MHDLGPLLEHSYTTLGTEIIVGTLLYNSGNWAHFWNTLEQWELMPLLEYVVTAVVAKVIVGACYNNDLGDHCYSFQARVIYVHSSSELWLLAEQCTDFTVHVVA
jgi:hypothetical protein